MTADPRLDCDLACGAVRLAETFAATMLSALLGGELVRHIAIVLRPGRTPLPRWRRRRRLAGKVAEGSGGSRRLPIAPAAACTQCPALVSFSSTRPPAISRCNSQMSSECTGVRPWVSLHACAAHRSLRATERIGYEGDFERGDRTGIEPGPMEVRRRSAPQSVGFDAHGVGFTSASDLLIRWTMRWRGGTVRQRFFSPRVRVKSYEELSAWPSRCFPAGAPAEPASRWLVSFWV
jgi:hypothetical protein